MQEWWKRSILACGLVATLAAMTWAAQTNDELEIGGPLAGLKLPPFRQGDWGEIELYPGAVEHYRAYMLKYLPIRSFFDRQSMLRNWAVPRIPTQGTQPAVEQFRAPIYTLNQSTTGAPTGKYRDPVPVVRCRVRDPIFALDLGELDIGLYAVRIIGAVETAKLRRFREPLYLTMRINDGPKGEVSTYRLRVGYVDDFYSIAEFYFHALEKRAYRAEVFVDTGSTVDLLVHNITLDDCLVGVERRVVKTKMTLTEPETVRKPPASAASPARLDRDAALWRAMPPINAQGYWIDYNVPLPGVSEGVADKTLREIEEEHGAWEPVRHGITGPVSAARFTRNPADQQVFLINRKLGLKYSIDDLWARKPLPDPFPYKDDGSGLFFPAPQNPDQGRIYCPVANEVGRRLRAYQMLIANGANAWRSGGDAEMARDAAVALVRFAYQYPTIDTANFFSCITVIPGPYNRDLRCRQREEMQRWMPGYDNYVQPLADYDRLFDFIQGNEDLARSVGRFVPWIKSPEDVIRLIDMYLVQHGAKRILRYHDHGDPTDIAKVATIAGDRKLTDPWMEWLFTKTFVYPLEPAGLQDLMITGCDREGPEYIGSIFYAHGEGALRIAAGLERYLATGGDPKYDLGNPALYPKPLAHCYWMLRVNVAGYEFPRIGDVAGPDKRTGQHFGSMGTAARWGWKLSRDPRFAWMLKHAFGRSGQSDAEWAEIEAAAQQVKRAPWLDLRSRAIENWCGVLESGLAHDDYRFRRAAYVRVGLGIGHEHQDTLDLHVVAHGLPMTVDGGQRSGYSKPNDRHFARTHNVVEVDGNSHRAYSYIRALSDGEGARYLDAVAVPPKGVSQFRRQVALIDVDEGQGSRPLQLEEQRPDAPLPRGVVTANSYVFDVFRVGGGQVHTYCFHAMVDDDFQWNARNVTPVAHVPDTRETRNLDSDANYLAIFSESEGRKFAGDCPEILTATWRYTRQGRGSEQQMLGRNFDAAAPRKFTRLHLLDAAGARALRADVVCIKDPIQYRFTTLMAQKRARQGMLQSAFPAIIEAYAGEPFIGGVTLLPVHGNDADALKAVAIQVSIPQQRQRVDLCFADGRPDKTRNFKTQNAECRIAGEFAYYSVDNDGLRQATLTGGTLLETPQVTLRPAARERTARVTKVGYLAKTLWLDQPWPAAASGRLFEIGTPAQGGKSEHRTSYTAASVVPETGGARIVVTHGADFYRSPIASLDIQKNELRGKLDFALGTVQGRIHNWALTNDTMTKSWRADHLGGPAFRLDKPARLEDFQPSGAFRLWEYGVGDEARQPTLVNLRRIAQDTYELEGDVDVTIEFKDGTRKTITLTELTQNNGKITLRIR